MTWAQIDRTDRITEFVARAFAEAVSGRPGPVVLVLPEDTLWGSAAVPDVAPFERARPCPSDAEMGRLAELLEEEAGKGPLRILMHCYTSGAELARRAVALGAYISFSGIMTFKNADDVRAIAMETPLDRIIVETDCPYLTPVPFRGQRCEPHHVATGPELRGFL